MRFHKPQGSIPLFLLLLFPAFFVSLLLPLHLLKKKIIIKVKILFSYLAIIIYKFTKFTSNYFFLRRSVRYLCFHQHLELHHEKGTIALFIKVIFFFFISFFFSFHFHFHLHILTTYFYLSAYLVCNIWCPKLKHIKLPLTKRKKSNNS